MRKQDLFRLTLLAAVLTAAFVIIALRLRPDAPQVSIPTLMALPTEAPTVAPAVAELPTTTNTLAPTDTATDAPTSTSTATDTATQTAAPTDTLTNTPTNTITDTATSIPTLPPASPSTALPTVAAQLAAPPAEPVDNQVVITFAPETSAEEREAYIESIGGEVTRSIDALNTVVVEIPETSAELPPSDLVEEAEPDRYVTALIDVPPNDRYYNQQWALPAMNVPNAWQSLPENAPTVIVAVIDSGICADHPDLENKVLPGWDYIEDDNAPQDDYGHGCGVAGIIAANSNNSIGIAGVAPNALILPLRVLDAQGVGTYSDVAAAIVAAADQGAQVINLSLGGTVSTAILENAVNYAISRGAIVVAAAGNSGQPGVFYPAAYAPVIAVASVGSDLQPSSFNSTGPEVDVYAPGQSVLSLLRTGAYGTLNGTSFAAPQVSGIAALEIGRGRSLTINGSVISASGDVPQPTSPPLPTASPEATLDGGGLSLNKPEVAALSSALDQLLRSYRESGALAVQESEIYGLQVEGDRVHVNLIMLNDAAADAAVAALPGLGSEVTARYSIWIDAWVPIVQLEQVAQLPGVTLVQPVVLVFAIDSPAQVEENVHPQAGSVTSQGVTWSNANVWHSEGLTGTGVKIAVLDVGFAGYQAQLGNNLPATVNVYTPDPVNKPLLLTDIHGTAVAEIVHDMAPGAELTFATPYTATDMASYIVALAQTHDIITSSIAFPATINGSASNLDPNDGTGPISQAINTAYYTHGALYVQAAGNSAQTHWEGIFTSTETPDDGLHEFDNIGSNNSNNSAPNLRELNQIGNGPLPAGTRITASLRWNAWPVTDQDYELLLYRWDSALSSWQYVTGSTTNQSLGGVAPLEFIQYTVPPIFNNQPFALAIYRDFATDVHVLDLHAYVNYSFENQTPQRSLVDPATGEGAMAVAAVSSSDSATFYRQGYSSVGPAHPDNNDWWSVPGTGNAQVRIAGYDGVNYSLGMFFGTSAAAPHVAGAAALVMQRHPEYSAEQVRLLLESRAIDNVTTPAESETIYDYETGVGRLWLGDPAVLPPPTPTVLPAANVGYSNPTFGSSCNSTPSGEKPQSKLWWTDGLWWGVLCSSDSRYHIYYLNLGNQQWVDTGVLVDSRTGTKVDVLWDEPNQKLYVLSHIFSNNGSSGSQEARLYRYSYNPSNDSYSLDAGFPSVAARGQWPNVVLAKDSTGQLWITMIEGNRIRVNRTTGSDVSWGSTFEIPTATGTQNTSSDDISSIVAFNNQIGVIWSNQRSDTVYFAIHRDSDGDTVWQPLEIVASSNNIADDHFNVHADSTGRLFVASKTSLGGNNPLAVMYRRLTNGTWSSHTFGTVADGHTRPILLLDESNNRVYMFATSPESGGAIYYKSTSMNSPNFPPGQGALFISNSGATRINNAASTDQNVNSTTGIVVIATDQETRRYYHNYLPITGGGVPTNTPTHTPTNTPTAPTNLLINGDFSSGMTGWTTFGHITQRLVGGVFEFYHNTSLGGTRPSIVQQVPTAINNGTPLELSVDLGNSGPTRKRALVFIVNQNWSDLQVCSFWIAPNSPLRTYVLQGRPTTNWSSAQVAVYANPADNTGWLRADNFRLTASTGTAAPQTRCIDPTAPAPGSGSDSGNMIVNGGFSAGTTNWITYGSITQRLNGGVFEFYHNTTLGAVRPSLLQNTNWTMAVNSPLELQLQLGNSGPTRKRALVILFEHNWNDLQVCSFWIPPNTPLQNYVMRTHTTTAWTNASVAVYANPDDNTGWLQVDNLTLRRRPSLSLSGTTCYEPGASINGLGGVLEEVMPSLTPSLTPSVTVTETWTETPTTTATLQPSETATGTPTPTATEDAAQTQTVTPEWTATLDPTATLPPTPIPTEPPTSTPTESAVPPTWTPYPTATVAAETPEAPPEEPGETTAEPLAATEES